MGPPTLPLPWARDVQASAAKRSAHGALPAPHSALVREGGAPSATGRPLKDRPAYVLRIRSAQRGHRATRTRSSRVMGVLRSPLPSSAGLARPARKRNTRQTLGQDAERIHRDRHWGHRQPRPSALSKSTREGVHAASA
ncbi:hypothetical protein AcV7_006991 [Taiwanofungus camphoratus]|nr:hypothetical protein AcV7_006991 [Antrodia cinnamomea]